MASYHRPRIGAILLAILFAFGTGYVLLEDVLRHGAEFTSAHLQTVLALIGTIAAGHMFLPEIKAGRYVTAAGFALLFIAGTVYIATASGARNAQAAHDKRSAAAASNDVRDAAMDKLAEAETDLAQAKHDARKAAAEAASECASGKGKKCEGKTATRDAADRAVEKAESHVLMMQARVNVLKPKADTSNGYAHAGRVFASFPYVTASADTITQRLELLMPYLLVLISELGTLTFSALALTPRHTVMPPAAASAQTSFPATPRDLGTVQEFLASRRGQGGQPQPPKPGAAKRLPQAEREIVVRGFVEAYRAKHGRDPEPREVRQATGLPRASAHRWQRRVETQIAGR